MMDDGLNGGLAGGDDGDEEEMSVEDLAESNQILLSALIEVLTRKGVISQAEIDAEVEDIQSEEDDDAEEDDDEEEGDNGGEEDAPASPAPPGPAPTPAPAAPTPAPSAPPPSNTQPPSGSPGAGVAPQRPGF